MDFDISSSPKDRIDSSILTLKGNTSMKLHKKRTGCLTPKGIQMCAMLTVLDILLEKNY